jgi:hypothetical protein
MIVEPARRGFLFRLVRVVFELVEETYRELLDGSSRQVRTFARSERLMGVKVR